MHTNYVFLIDTNKRPLNPIHPARARELLSKGKANVFRVYPFTLILKTAITSPNLIPIELKIDPGSKITGLALVQNGDVIWRGNLEHRGLKIKDSLEKRKTVRRSRRNRKTRYRKARFLNRKRSDKWLPPSLMHRVLTTETWVKRLIKFAPITSISMELMKFDTQKMNNPEINGVEYQQGELFGYEVREYLLEKWGRACIYCGKKDTPLEIEHIQPKSKGGSDRVSNLTLACHCCNQKKADKPIEVFLKKKPEVLKKIQLTAKAPLKDAAAVNATRWKLFQTLKEIGLPVSTGTGGQTKFNRLKNKLEKDHSLDAACVGTTGLGVILRTDKPLIIKCFGLSNRQLVRMNKYGFPCAAARKNYKIDWKTGDIARHISGLVGRVVVQNAHRLEVRIGKARKGGPISSFFQLHAADGYEYYV